MRDTNCPNCGAVRTGDKCEYCGTVFDSDLKSKIERLKTENEILMRVTAQEELYRVAMTSIFTPNEMRRMIYDRT